MEWRTRVHTQEAAGSEGGRSTHVRRVLVDSLGVLAWRGFG